MKKPFAILLLVLLPLQAVWANASLYCSHHEQGEAADHFGHHADEHGPSQTGHEHEPTSDNALDDADQQPHTDHHHAGAIALPPHVVGGAVSTGADGPAVRSAQPPPTAPASRIERPKWSIPA